MPNALIYLLTSTPADLTEDDLERLDSLHTYAQRCGYKVTEVWPVRPSQDSGDSPKEWSEAHEALRNGRFDVILVWHEAPTALTRKDLGFFDPSNEDGPHLPAVYVWDSPDVRDMTVYTDFEMISAGVIVHPNTPKAELIPFSSGRINQIVGFFWS